MRKMVEIYSGGGEYYYYLDGKKRGGFSTKQKAQADAKEMNRVKKLTGQKVATGEPLKIIETPHITMGDTNLSKPSGLPIKRIVKGEWFDLLKKDPRRAKKARKKRKKGKGSPYTNPKLRAEVVAEAKAKVFGDGKGGNASGKWSGRKAQWAAREYKKRGGGYR